MRKERKYKLMLAENKDQVFIVVAVAFLGLVVGVVVGLNVGLVAGLVAGLSIELVVFGKWIFSKSFWTSIGNWLFVKNEKTEEI